MNTDVLPNKRLDVNKPRLALSSMYSRRLYINTSLADGNQKLEVGNKKKVRKRAIVRSKYRVIREGKGDFPDP